MADDIQAQMWDLASFIEEARISYAGEHASGTFRAIGLKLAELQRAIIAGNHRHSGGDGEDAARYRWLRAEHAENSPLAHVCWKKNGDRECGDWVNTGGPDQLDAAIDAARAGERG